MRHGASRADRRAGAGVLVLGILAAACGGSETPTTTDERVSALQLREVQDVVSRMSPEWDATELTCPAEHGAGCLADRRDEPVVVLGAGPMDKYLLGPVVVDAGDVAEAKAHEDPAIKGWAVSVQLSPEGSRALASATRAAAGDRIAIVVDGLVVSAPTVQQPVTAGGVVVGGGLSRAEAEGLASSLNGED